MAREAAREAKSLERKTEIAESFANKGLTRKSWATFWQYAETLVCEGAAVPFRIEVPVPFDLVTTRFLNQALKECRAKGRALRVAVCHAMARARRDYQSFSEHWAGVLQVADVERLVCRALKSPFFTPDAIAHDILELAAERRRSAWYRGDTQTEPGRAELWVGVANDKVDHAVALVWKIPGQKPRIRLHSARVPVEHLVKAFLAARPKELSGRRILVRAPERCRAVLAALPALGPEKAVVTSPAPAETRILAVRYLTQWKRTVPRRVREAKTQFAGKVEGNPFGHVSVFTDASVRARGSGVAALVYPPESDSPVVGFEQSSEIRTQVLEARAVVLGLQMLERLHPGQPAKVFTDCRLTVDAFKAFRHGGRFNWNLATAAAGVDPQWLLAAARRCDVEYVQGHRNNPGNEQADRAAYRAARSGLAILVGSGEVASAMPPAADSLSQELAA
ncbi:RNase H family protein [Paraburkholderia sp. UCT31]|uniref:RNase H family protein n=1 Tax=Paraburkholderia sp. UCT31 TaxID=2615209 RepID=UPI001654FA61|nr:RNase H family protein [Paraburkholderia sp. UCT31]